MVSEALLMMFQAVLAFWSSCCSNLAAAMQASAAN
jgi:hypothetical protein